MDKKKVKELIFEAHHCIEEVFDRQADNNNAIDATSLAIASIILLTAISELSKSDWVSVENRLPEYGESVLVTNKETPEIVLKTSRTKCKGWNTDKNGFLCAVAFNITHWKPIEKLEE